MNLITNEIGWSVLLKILNRLINQNLTDDQVWAMNYLEKSSLVTEDPVTCAIYFNKLVMTSMQSQKIKVCLLI